MKKAHRHKRHFSPRTMAVIVGVTVVVMLVAGGLVLNYLYTAQAKMAKNRVQKITLVAPPPPPKETPPPPKQEEVKPQETKAIESPKEIMTPETDSPKDEGKPPIDDNLGLDAAGSAGADGFGLQSKQGGTGITQLGGGGGGGGGGNPMRVFGWYNQLVEKELRQRVEELLSKSGGIPQGNYKVIVNLFLDDQGQIVRSSIYTPSGNGRLDTSLQEAMQQLRISQRPPEGMPRGMRIAINSKG